MGIVIKGVLALFWLIVIPAAVGIHFTGKKHLSFPEVFLSGYLILFSVMELLTLVMIYWKVPLHSLTAVYGCVGGGLTVFGIFYMKRKKERVFVFAETKRKAYRIFLDGSSSHPYSSSNVRCFGPYGCRRLFLCRCSYHRRLYRYHISGQYLTGVAIILPCQKGIFCRRFLFFWL